VADQTLTHTITAFFDGKSDADLAINDLVEAGVTRSAITLSGGTEDDPIVSSQRTGFWDRLESFFFPEDDRHVYAEGLRRGGYLVTVSGLTLDQQEVAADLLDDKGAVDIHERSQGWRSEGWAPEALGSSTDTSDFANSTFDQTDGTLVGGDIDDAFHSRRAEGDERASIGAALPTADGLVRSGEQADGRHRVRFYASESAKE
jgi:hypothetical protein